MGALMNQRFGLGFLLATLAACGGGTGADGGGDDTVDPPVDASDVDPPARGFQVVSKEIDILPGQEITYCYYFRTPNTEPMAVHTWKSVMTPGSHHMIMFTTATEVMPEGTVSASKCGFGGGGSLSNTPIWTYAAQTPTVELALPTDDGAGLPLAQEIAPNTPAFFQMHYLNATEATIKVHVTLNAEALPAGAPYTKTAAYVTYNDDIEIPAMSTNVVQTKTCAVPANVKFWTMSTHSHKQAVKTEVMSGNEVAFMSTDWEHPGAQNWMSKPFFSFANDQLTFSCTYNNSTSRTITAGDSAATDEMCMATGYYFPATTPKICYCPENLSSCVLL
ncbi:MAG: hypothetical protein SFX73_40055 [Kofleriaceae bacterium]|nr:hypothetical protein [Kofleriaceae bacterium]